MSRGAASGGGSSGVSGVQLPVGVVERLPMLKDEVCVFFDFGVMLFPPPNTPSADVLSGKVPLEAMSREPVVAVVTERGLIVATFPRATRQPRVAQHDRIIGVVKEGENVLVRVNGEPDIPLQLSKRDTFVVYLVDVQDRAIGRSVHFAAGGGSSAPSGGPQAAAVAGPTAMVAAAQAGSSQRRGSAMTATASASATRLTHDALRAADEAAAQEEIRLGAIRLGRASRRAVRPPRELDEGSDASSVGTTDHAVAAADDGTTDIGVDFPLVSMDATTLRQRLFYFFEHYDRSKLPHLEEMARHHRGRETQLMAELQKQYGPEPKKARWETRDQIAHQKRLQDQLEAQLKRARDELLLLHLEDASLQASRERVRSKAEDLKAHLRERFLLSHQQKRHGGGRGDSDPAESGVSLTETGSPLPSLVLLKVTRLTQHDDSQQRTVYAPEVAGPQIAAPSGDEVAAFWLAPPTFFDFVKLQMQRVEGAAVPPLCVVEMNGLSMVCNWAFLAGWTGELGPHTVAAVARPAVPGKAAVVRYIPSTAFWRRR